MALPAPGETSDGRPVDPRALRRVAERLQRQPQPPWLHGEVARRMAERLGIVRNQPAVVVDWGAHLGASSSLLRSAYPRARVVAVESGPAPIGVRSDQRRRWWSLGQRGAARPDTLLEGDVSEGLAGLLWANMVLHGRADPLVQFQAWHRCLMVDGFLMFSTFGPGTLPELRALYRRHGWGEAMAPLVDMHDLGDMLVQAGFADPVMDQETVTLTWPDAVAALAELRGLGGNASRARHAGLRTPRWRDSLVRALQPGEAGSGLPVRLSFEVVYGHAFKAAPKVRLEAETRVSVQDMQRMIRRTRR